MKKLYIILILMLVTACASSPKRDDYVVAVKAKNIPISYPITIHLNPKQPVDVRGHYKNDNSITSSPVVYSGAAGIAGLFAQIATHAAINSGIRDSHLSKEQERANRVLMPMRESLSNFFQQSLVHHDERYQFSTDTDGITLLSKPIYFISQDKSTISLKHIVSIEPRNSDKKEKRRKKKSKKQLYTNIIEINAITLPSFTKLVENSALILKEKTLAMYKQSLNLALKDISGHYDTMNTKIKSYKIEIDDSYRLERGQLLEADCKTMVIKNLRGWIISLPEYKPMNKPLCQASQK